jgi:cobyrinic acid a,c-diamide synthase
MKHPRLLIAGTHSGVGKTTVSLSLMAAFRARGCQVQPFKVGPDFIDPGHHHLASGRESRNLDGWMLGADLNREIFLQASQGADFSIIEGMMGLFDGSSAMSDQGSAAEQAKQLGAPILLVVDGSAMARSAAAMVYGYNKFDPGLEIGGVLFNRIRSEGHYQLLKEVVEKDVGVKVVGYLRPDPETTIPDRHLGLQTAIERKSSDFYKKLGQAAAETVDLNLIEQVARSCRDMAFEEIATVERKPQMFDNSVKVGVAYDPAFCFYYQDDLELLEGVGAELIRFSPMNDQVHPDVDLMYFGGGYPEIYAEKLERNCSMRQSVREFARQGGLIYAECGGLMYLTETLRDFEQRTYNMVGVIPAETVMNRNCMTLGYRSFEVTRLCLLGENGTKVRGHEFHYSELLPHGDVTYVGQLTDAQGQSCGCDGIICDNVVGLYTHLHFKSQPTIARSLIHAARMKSRADV